MVQGNLVLPVIRVRHEFLVLLLAQKCQFLPEVLLALRVLVVQVILAGLSRPALLEVQVVLMCLAFLVLPGIQLLLWVLFVQMVQSDQDFQALPSLPAVLLDQEVQVDLLVQQDLGHLVLLGGLQDQLDQ